MCTGASYVCQAPGNKWLVVRLLFQKENSLFSFRYQKKREKFPQSLTHSRKRAKLVVWDARVAYTRTSTRARKRDSHMLRGAIVSSHIDKYELSVAKCVEWATRQTVKSGLKALPVKLNGSKLERCSPQALFVCVYKRLCHKGTFRPMVLSLIGAFAQ